MQSDDISAKQVHLRLVSTVCGEMQQSEHNGTIKSLGNKHLLCFSDENNTKTSLKLDDGFVHLIRNGAHINHSFSVRQNEQTTGIMGNTPFTVIGRKSDWQYDGKSGEIRLNYLLPDISDEPADFNIRITFSINE